MTLLLSPGNSLICKVNSHREGWRGTICTSPAAWNCGGEAHFRESYCAQGDPRCFHVRLFDPAGPALEIDESGGAWVLEQDLHALDDQVLLIWADAASEPRGIVGDRPSQHVVGAYRIRSVELVPRGHRSVWRARPYPEGWTSFHQLGVERPRYSNAGGPYIKQVDHELVLRVFAEAREAAERPNPRWTDDEERRRFLRFHEALPGWLDRAAEKIEARADFEPAAVQRALPSPVTSHRPFRDLSKILGDRELPATRPAEPPAQPANAVGVDQPLLLEPGGAARVREVYGEETLRALEVAVRTKPIIVLRGHPGVGKSHLAVRLLDDPERERTLIVPVASTWRGREDLLGYVSPLSGAFEPTAFTRFLLHAAEAWKKGDRRARVVVFEEFNLSQPEHWFSDFLSISQFGEEIDRVVQLGGEEVRGVQTGKGPSLFLSPAVFFVGTINNDHTTRPLSSRVLDRAAVVTLGIEPKDALGLAKLDFDEACVMAIADLDEVLRNKGAAFSLRAAHSLAACLPIFTSKTDGGGAWPAIDAVLVQEVLSKVRLFARDPLDEDLLRRLNRWRERHGRSLPRCSTAIADWEEQLKAGNDVTQA